MGATREKACCIGLTYLQYSRNYYDKLFSLQKERNSILQDTQPHCVGLTWQPE